MGTHPIFESDFDCLTDMSLADIAKRHREQKKTSSPLSLAKAKKEKGALSLGELLKAKKQPKTEGLNLSSLIQKKETASPKKVQEVTKKVEQLEIKEKIHKKVENKIRKRTSRLSNALSWPQNFQRKKKTQVNTVSGGLSFKVQIAHIENDDDFIFYKKRIIQLEPTKYLFDFSTQSPDAKVLDCQKKAFTR